MQRQTLIDRESVMTEIKCIDIKKGVREREREREQWENNKMNEIASAGSEQGVSAKT